MSLELLERIKDKLDEANKQSEQNKAFFEKHKDGLSKEAKADLFARQEKLVKEIEQMRKDRDDFIAARKKYEDSKSNEDYTNLLVMQYDLMKKYGVAEKTEVVTVRQPKKEGMGRTILKSAVGGLTAAVVFVTACLGLRGCANQKDRDIRSMLASAYIEEPAQSPTPTPFDGLVVETPAPVGSANPDATLAPETVATPAPTPAPTVDPVMAAIEEILGEEELFADYGNFTDAENEEQLAARINWYVGNYIDPLLPTAVSRTMLPTEQLKTDVKTMNKEGIIYGEDGTVSFEDSSVVKVMEDILYIGNMGSISTRGFDVVYTPFAPLFPDGSAAQLAAMQLDMANKRVYDSIRNWEAVEHDPCEVNEEFRQAAINWAQTFHNMFVLIDLTGNYMNVYQTEETQRYPLFGVWYSAWATILEYGQTRGIDVCFNDCMLADGEPHYIALSDYVTDILSKPIVDGGYARAGKTEEYINNHDPLPKQLLDDALHYYHSELEEAKGFGLKLEN